MDKEESFWDTLKTVFYAILIAILIRTVWFEPFKIPSGSMYPTLYVGDYLFVSKYTYGYSKHSLPFSLPLFNGRIWEDMPQRGDVVVFKFPQDNKTDFIKRIIGLPGDKVKMSGGRLYINGKAVSREDAGDFVIRDEGGNAERFHHALDALRAEQPHEVIFQRKIEAGGTGIALTAGTAAQLIVDAAAFMAFGAENVQAAQFAHALAKDDVRTAPGHVGGNGHRPKFTGLSDDLRLLFMKLGV